MDLKAIVSVYSDWGIGYRGTQPIVLRRDRKFFSDITKFSAVIYGRKTYEDIGLLLSKRINVILSSGNIKIPNALVCNNVQDALRVANFAKDAFVIGGESVYKAMLPYCNLVYVTKIHASPSCDTFFPNLDSSKEWRLSQEVESGIDSGYSYDIVIYERV